MRLRRLLPERVRRMTDRERCPSRHPNWHGARCELRRTSHIVHSAEADNLVWVDRSEALIAGGLE